MERGTEGEGRKGRGEREIAHRKKEGKTHR